MNPLSARLAALEECFRRIERERLRGLPMFNPALAVQAVDFEPEPGHGLALGVLVTPWFMNLVRLPLVTGVEMLAVGETAPRTLGERHFDFIGAHEAALGPFEACSLFSPMAEFADQAAALATAQAVLQQLRGRPSTRPPEQPARRGFLFGRRGVEG